MEHQEFLQGMSVLKASFPQSKVEFTELVLDTWFGLLKRIDGRAFKSTVDDILANNKFFPSIAEIREVAEQYRPKLFELEDRDYTVTPEQREINVARVQDIIDNLDL